MPRFLDTTILRRYLTIPTSTELRHKPGRSGNIGVAGANGTSLVARTY